MRYGYFDDEQREYVITTPDTPYPWINYLGSEKFFGLISHQGGGYCFYRDARLRRLLRYRYNNAPTDVGGGADPRFGGLMRGPRVRRYGATGVGLGPPSLGGSR